MAEYLKPNEENLSITQKQNIFAIRNRMVLIPSNFSKNNLKNCACGQIENMQHIYTCKMWRNGDKHEKTPFSEIFKDNISKQVEVSELFFNNYEKREKYEKQMNDNQLVSHVIQPCDPLSLIFENGNGL